MSAKGAAMATAGGLAVLTAIIGLITTNSTMTGAGFAVLLAVLVVASFTLRPNRAEQDVAPDDAVATTRATNGTTAPGTGDWRSCEGRFVGRAAGEPDSAAGTTGAERRNER